MNWVVPLPLFGAIGAGGCVNGEEAPAARTALDVLAESVGWWEADAASNTHDGSTFSQLTDLSGNGNDFVQATAANQPARLDTAGVISAEFDGNPSGGDDFMSLASPTAALANAHNNGGTTVAVFRADSRGEGGFARVFDFNSNTERLNVNSPGLPHDVFDVQFVMDMSGSDPNFETTSSIANGTLLLADFRYDKSSNDVNSAVMGINGNDLTAGVGLETPSTSGTPVDHSASTMYLGNRADGTRCFDGGIYALARWPTILSGGDMQLVREHFADKYGIALA